MTPKPLQLDYIKELLKNQRFGQNLYYEDSVDSTNIVIKKYIETEQKLPIVLFAEEQTAGKGRLKRSWSCPKYKGLMFTVAYPQVKDLNNFGHYNFIASLIVASGIESITDLQVRFKWPNDVLLNNKKICGILSENISSSNNRNTVVTGIGINVNLTKNDFGAELQNSATSLMIEKGTEINRERLFTEIIYSLNTIYSVWSEKGIEPLFKQWIEKCNTIGKHVEISTEKQYISGTAKEVNVDGSLLLEDEHNKLHRIYAGDLHYTIK